jgi:hypothetical protein
VAEALAGAVDAGRMGGLLLSEIDGEPAQQSRLVPALLAAGFSAVGAGYLRRRKVAEMPAARAPGQG